MPFKSEAQRRYLWAKEPAVAKRWSKKYGVPKNLPKKVNLNETIKRAKRV